jgi:hypothetical protein
LPNRKLYLSIADTANILKYLIEYYYSANV